MGIRLFEELSPVTKKSDGASFIEEKSREKIQTQLNEQAERERLLSKTTNTDPNMLQFETIQPHFFRLFDREFNPTHHVENDDNILTLMPVGNLSLLHYDKPQSTPQPVTTLNIKQYQEERNLNLMQVVAYSVSDHVAAMDTIDEDNFSSSQFARDVLEDILRPEHPTEHPTPPAQRLVEHPTREMVETNTEQHAQQPNEQRAEQNTEQPNVQPETGAQITIESSDSEMEDVESTTVQVEPVAVQPTLPESTSNVSEDSVSSPPTIITPSGPVRPLDPPAPTSAELPTTPLDHWFNDDMITEKATYGIVTSQIYAYKPQMIPIFPTETQKERYDAVTKPTSATKNNASFNLYLEKTMDILNLPFSSLDTVSEEKWDQSGKTMFIKDLLQNLIGMDLILMIVGKDLTEEGALVNLVEDTLNLDYARINYLLDDGWNGEYGVIVDTSSKINQAKGAATERGKKFTRTADFIICMDIRISKDNSLLEKITKRGTTDTLAPVGWLTCIGSIEERTFNYLAEHNITYSARKSDDLKEVMVQDDNWKFDTELSVEKLNHLIADNVKYWLADIKSRNQYQYRSTLHLPKSYVYAHLKPLPVVTEENTSDMDIGSDSEDTQIAETPSLSEAAISYVDKVIIPIFDIDHGTLVQTDASELYTALTDQEKQLFDSLPKELSTDYRNEITNLKRQYETAFQTLHDKFHKETMDKIENTRSKNT